MSATSAWISRALAPAVSLGKRAVRAEFWAETERRVDGRGPVVEMSHRPGVQKPRDGAGPLNHRRYRVSIADSDLTPSDLIGAFRRDPNAFAPTSFAEFDPTPGPEGLLEGDKTTVRLPGPWDGPVVVTNVGDDVVRFETLEDHMEAGWIEFIAAFEGTEIVFSVESFARSGDPVFDVLYHPGKLGRLVQTEMWVRVLESAVEISSGKLVGRPIVDTIIYEGADT